MSNIFDAIPTAHREIIESELAKRNAQLFAELQSSEKPTNEQSDAVVDSLINAMSENYGPGHVPNEYGKAVDAAIGAYLLAWPVYR